MAFCPFYNLQCPEMNDGEVGCALWTKFGCCVIEKPGIPAIYSGGAEPEDVFIIRIFSSNAKVQGDILIVFAYNSDGTIGTSDDLSKFVIYRLH